MWNQEQKAAFENKPSLFFSAAFLEKTGNFD